MDTILDVAYKRALKLKANKHKKWVCIENRVCPECAGDLVVDSESCGAIVKLNCIACKKQWGI